MRVLLVLGFFIGLVSCGDLFNESPDDIYKKWSNFKAMESCLGEEVTKNFLLKMKKAHSKCSNQPILDFYVQAKEAFKTTNLVRSLLDGSAMVEKESIAKLKAALGLPDFDNKNFVPYFVPYAAPASKSDDDEIFTDAMKKVFAKKILKKFVEEDKEESAVKKSRKRRDAVDPVDPDNTEESTDIAGRLTAKILQQKTEMASKLSNYSCILQEMNFIDSSNNLNLEGIMESLNTSGIKDEWLLEKIREGKQQCYDKAQALPESVLNGCVVGPQWVKIKEFMCCCKQVKQKACMAFDTKLKLEANFGPLDKIVAEADVSEKQLLTMAAKMVYGSFDDDN